MVDNIKAAIEMLAASRGAVTLALLCRIGEENFKWTLVIASRWSDQESIQVSTRAVIDSLARTLSKYELPFISNVKVLNTSDPFVQKFNSLYSHKSSGDKFKNLMINDEVYSEVIIIKSSSDNHLTATRQPRSKDPRLNRTINPIFNRTINPIFNRTINPIFNSTLNPGISFNPNVDFVYNQNLNNLYYIVRASEDIALYYNFQNEWELYSVKANEIVDLVYNKSNEWKFYTVKASENVRILYDSSNIHIGFIVTDNS